VSTGVDMLDRLLGLAAQAGGLVLRLEVADGVPEEEIDAAGSALGRALDALVRAPGATGHGSGTMPTDEALATVVLEASGRPLVASNADLEQSHLGGLETDLTRRFLAALAETAGLTIHVRLVEGEDSVHVVEAIFKALGVAIAEACTVNP
jgi:imidazoleglycerol-phosphate dehydratase